MRFTSERFDAQTGLYHLRARQYDPALGRFTTTDPIESAMGSQYAYVSNRPTVLVDPSGFCGWAAPWRCLDDAAKASVQLATGNLNDALGTAGGAWADFTGGTPTSCGNATCVQGSWLVPPGASAWTLGHTIIGRGDVSGCLLEHELTHVRQYEDSGVFFLPIYAWDTAFNGYEGNIYEIEAYAVQSGCRAEAALGQNAK